MQLVGKWLAMLLSVWGGGGGGGGRRKRREWVVEEHTLASM